MSDFYEALAMGIAEELEELPEHSVSVWFRNGWAISYDMEKAFQISRVAASIVLDPNEIKVHTFTVTRVFQYEDPLLVEHLQEYINNQRQVENWHGSAIPKPNLLARPTIKPPP